MRKEQDRKPNYSRDIDTEILDELTQDGAKSNVVGLVGTVKEIKEVERLCGLRFCGYLAMIETPRPSGQIDEVAVAFLANVPLKQNGAEFDVLREFTAGSRLLVSGRMQTLKDHESGRVLVYVLAEWVGLAVNGMMQDDVAVCGVLAKEPVYRTTPRGKRITDIFIKVDNVLTGKACFIPCICWQEQADEAATWQRGDKVELLGRYQSREYEKVIDESTGEREKRTAYEVSARLIRRKGEATDAEKNDL